MKKIYFLTNLLLKIANKNIKFVFYIFFCCFLPFYSQANISSSAKSTVKDTSSIEIFSEESVMGEFYRREDSLQLITFYHHTNGDSWRNTWNLAKPMNTWYGVTLDSLGRVISIKLSDNQLTGHIPALKLSRLKVLDLHWNELSGNIATLSKLPNLRYLDLSSNQLIGNISDIFGNSLFLQSVDLHWNQLSGEMPSLPNLQRLCLSHAQNAKGMKIKHYEIVY